jgi:hypothetical protein
MPVARPIVLALLAALLAAAPLSAEMPEGFGLLRDSDHGWLGHYLGKIGAAGSGYDRGGETCSAVIVAPRWILTAAHCVHRKRALQRPWTPQYFGGMYPLEALVFSPIPIGRSRYYRIVGAVTSPGFPDPGAATDDWAFLELDRPVPVDPAGFPEVVPSRAYEHRPDILISGFPRALAAPPDWAGDNEPKLSRAACRVTPYEDPTHGPMPSLIDIDCIPAVNPGLSGGPLLAFDGVGPAARARILGIQMGAGERPGGTRRVAVLVRSEQFLAAYRTIVATAPAPPR